MLTRRITHILLCYRRRQRRRLDLRREFREILGCRLPIRNRARCAPHLLAASATMPILSASASLPVSSGPLIVNDHACYFAACVWDCYGRGSGGGLEVGDDAGEY